MKVKQLVCLVLFVGYSISAMGQIGEDAVAGSNNSTMLSPSAAAFSTYGELPVNHFNGVPDIDIPLFSIKEQDLPAFDIKLKYNSAMTRTIDMPDWVGQGWSLMAGGVITRVVNDIPDEQFNGYINTVDKLREDLFDGGFTDAELQVFITNNILVNRLVDSAPDDFYFSFGNKSGRLFLDEEVSGEIDIKTFPITPLKIEFLYGSYAWKITDTDGTEYYFDATETSPWSTCGSCSPTDVITAWYLTKIRSVSGNEITLSYSHPTGVSYQMPLIEEEFVHIVTAAWQTPPNDISITKSSHIQRPFLESITSGAYSIQFNRSSRTDITNDQQLDEIVIKSQSNEVIKKYDFRYDDCSAASCGPEYKRLFLKEVTESNSAGEKLPPYVFEYNETAIPSPISKSVDHWGYYNGVSETVNTTFIPTDVYYNDVLLKFKAFMGADRSPKGAYTQAGILTKIFYPTGGYTSLEYEPHVYSDMAKEDGNLREVEKQGLPTLVDHNNTDSEVTSTFTISGSTDEPSIVYLKAAIQYCENGAGGQSPCQSTPPDGLGEEDFQWVKIIDTSDGSEVYATNSTINTPILLTNGTYRLEVNMITQDPLALNVAQGELTIYEEKTKTNVIGGGNRIKKMITHDGVDSGNDMIKEYIYEFNGTSTGVVHYQPNYQYKGVGYISLSSRPIQIGGSLKHLGYRKIRVNYGVNGDDGYRIMTFNLPKSQNPFTGIAISYVGFEDESYSYGQLAKQELFKSNDEEISETINTYYDSSDDLNASPAIYGRLPHITYKTVGKGYQLRCNPYGCAPLTDTFFVYDAYEQGIPWTYLESATSKLFDSSGELISTVAYNYDNEDHLLLTSKVETNSLTSEKRITTYEYAHEQVSSPNYSAMEGLHMLSQPYSVLVEDGAGNDLSKSWTEWALSTINVWRPWKQKVWKGSGPGDVTADLSEAISTSVMLKYDAYGNPIEVQALGNKTKFYFGSNTEPFSQNGLNGVNGVYLTGIQKQKGTTGDDLFTEATYDELGRMTSITDENGQTIEYGYDAFHRLIRTVNQSKHVVTTNGYSYSKNQNNGVFDPLHPNTVSSTGYIDPVFYSDFSSSSGWSSVNTTHNVFNTLMAGETTVRMGSGGSWESIFVDLSETDIIARIDFYADHTTQGTPHIMLSSGGNRFAVHYKEHLDQFLIQYQKDSGTFESPFIFPLDAPIDRWYTIEIAKAGSELTAWVYPKGEARNPENRYSLGGFSSSWVPDFVLTGNSNYYYVANLNIARSWQSSTSYLDGLGREVQAQQRGGDKVIATETLYNERGLPEVVSRPVETTATAFPGYYSSGLLSGGGTFTPGQAVPSAAPVHTYYAPILEEANEEDYAYSQMAYEDSPLARVEKSTLPGSTHKMDSGKEVETRYGLNTTETFSINGTTWAANTLNKVVSEDPSGKETIIYTDGWGRTIASGVDMDGNGRLDGQNKGTCSATNCDLITEFAYDERGNLVRVEDPRGLPTMYRYNALGQLEMRKLPDQADSIHYKYDKNGNLRFTENANHKQSGSAVSYTQIFDQDGGTVNETISTSKYGRLSFEVVVWPDYGDYDADIKTLNESIVSEYSGNDGGWDITLSNQAIVGAGSYQLKAQSSYTQETYNNFGSGYYKFDPFKYSYTRYDELNRPVEVGEYYGGTPFSNADADDESFPTSDRVKLVEYKYDQDDAYGAAANLQGRLAQVWYYDPNDLAVSGKTYYSYNNLGLVEWVVQDLPGLSSKTIRYTYDATGRLTRLHFDPSGTGDDHYFWYYYDELGRLSIVKSYSSNSEGSALTEAEYTYVADGQVDRLILGDGAQTVDYDYTVQGWMEKINNADISSGDVFGMFLDYELSGNIKQQQWKQAAEGSTPSNYYYTYDDANRLTTACYESSGCTSTTMGAFDVRYGYDKNGGITWINRADHTAHEMTYTSYLESGANKLDYVYVDGISGETQAVQKQFSSDPMGNVVENQVQGIDNTSYDWRNLPNWLVAGGSALRYTYDGEGKRVKKELVDGATTYYIRGADGQTIAAYDGSGSLLFLNILSGGQIIGQIEN